MDGQMEDLGDVGMPVQMSYDELERVLKYLPEPTSVAIDLEFRTPAYKDIRTRLQELVSGVRIFPSCEYGEVFPRLTVSLDNPTKQQISEIYKLRDDSIKGGEDKSKENIFFSVTLHKAEWHMGGGSEDSYVFVGLTPYGVTVQYHGNEPEFISAIRKELPRADTSLEMKLDKAE